MKTIFEKSNTLSKKVFVKGRYCIFVGGLSFFLFTTTLLFSAFTSPPQRPVNNLAGNYHLTTQEWVLDKTVNNVDFFYRIAMCNGASTVYLKIENKNSVKVILTWKDVFVTDKVLVKSAAVYGEKKLELSPLQTVSADCNENGQKECRILAKEAFPQYRAVIQNYEFNNVNVSLIN